MEQMPHKEQIDETLKLAVERAKEAALPSDEYEEKNERFEDLAQKERTEEGLSEEEKSEYEALEQELETMEVSVGHLYQYRKVLEYSGFPPKEVDEILNHENAHANVAEQVESHEFDSYKVVFKKDETGKILARPFVVTNTNESFPRERVMEDTIKVIEAPEKYGGELSDSDRKDIEALRKDIKKIAPKDIKKKKDLTYNAPAILATSEKKPGIFSELVTFLWDFFKTGNKRQK